MYSPLTIAALLLCIFLQFPGLCLATGNVTVRLMRYFHAEDRLNNGRFCDEISERKSSSCDPLITVCLGQMRSYCDLLHSSVPVMENTIHFDYKEFPKKAPTFVLRAQSLPPLIFLKVTVRDSDSHSGRSDLIATFSTTVSLRMGTSMFDLYSDDNDDIEDMEVEVSAFCDADYYGLMCNRFCQARFANEECTATGERRCRKGYYGPQCAFQRCFAANPCQNGGRCKQGPRGQICVCPDRFSGERCEIPDPCLSHPCLNDAACSWKKNSTDFGCRCRAHFRGPRCREFVPCLSSPCLNGGECQPAVADSQRLWRCKCNSEFLPPRCDLPDLCSSAPCLNAGRCSTRVSGGRPQFVCTCAPGFSGTVCEVRRDPCSTISCLNGGVCEGGKSAACRCPPGTSGKRCEKGESAVVQATVVASGRRVLNAAVIAVLAGGGVCFLTLIVAVVVIAKRRQRRGEKLAAHDTNQLFQESMPTEDSSVRSSLPMPRHVAEPERMKDGDFQDDENQFAYL